MPLQRVRTGDKNLELIQDSVQRALKPLDQSPFAGGVLVSGVSLTAGQDNLVAHNLGKNVTAWAIARLDSNATVWEQSSTSLSNQSANSQYLNLHCSANCTVSVWVY